MKINLGKYDMDKFSIVIIFVICSAWQVNAAVNCTSTGRFPEPTDPTCKNYTLCVLSGTAFIGYNYVCPTTSLFNPRSRQCTTNYTCPAVGQTNTTTSVCTAEGFVPDPGSTNCTSYIQCISQNGSFVAAATLTCPPGTFYNPANTFCESTYNCTTARPFSCTSTGRFPNPANTNCKSYYLCVLATNGTFFNYQYTCPTTSVFNPNSRLCTTLYTCPTTT